MNFQLLTAVAANFILSTAASSAPKREVVVNAMAPLLIADDGWNAFDANLTEAVAKSSYSGLTLLRMTDIAKSPLAQNRLSALSGVAQTK